MCIYAVNVLYRYIPETQETVRPHPDFLIFATQNPPGVYGGRKVLSRAFANRFVVLHYDDLPENELLTILEKACSLPPSYCKCMIEVMKDLQRRRERTQVFAGKGSLITPRDLFRWGTRRPQGYQQLAEDGYMLLGERLRTADARLTVKEVLQKHCRVTLDMAGLYDRGSQETQQLLSQQIAACVEGKHELATLAWTASLKRLVTIVRRCVANKEPVLLVGETGCGKTTVCQLLASVVGQTLRVINCHQHSETSDFLGGLRPVRGKEQRESELIAQLQAFLKACSTAHPLLLSPEALDKTSRGKVAEQMVVFTEVVAKLKIQAKLIKQILVKQKQKQQEVDKQKQLNSKNKKRKHNEVANSDEKVGHMEVSAEAELETPLLTAQQLTSLRKLSKTVAAAWGRNQSLFEWHDGAVVQAMKEGDLLLIDEISLAEDAVLERLNSVLESERTLLLAEKGGSPVEVIVGHENFLILATMNPGGDFGKKELSPALRNRFTEVWVPSLDSHEDLLRIISDRCAEKALQAYAPLVLDFFQWFTSESKSKARCISLRDILSWVMFLNKVGASHSDHGSENMSLDEVYLHGACLVILDGLGIGTGESANAAERFRIRAVNKLLSQFPTSQQPKLRNKIFAELTFSSSSSSSSAEGSVEVKDIIQEEGTSNEAIIPEGYFGYAPFYIPLGDEPAVSVAYTMQAKTTNSNLLRVK